MPPAIPHWGAGRPPVSAGYDLRGAVHKIWMGERRLAALQQNTDAGTREVIKAILFHATKYDNSHGHKRINS